MSFSVGEVIAGIIVSQFLIVALKSIDLIQGQELQLTFQNINDVES